jgi:hypothetical protein
MGLDARVRCNCVRDGLALPHPIPERLRFDENGEPFVEVESGGIGDEVWAAHENWLNNGCLHGGYLIEKRLGNLMRIVHVRTFVESYAASNAFPILRERVVYSGTHCGDSINAADAAVLLEELRELQRIDLDNVVSEFAADLVAVCGASVTSGNPVVF